MAIIESGLEAAVMRNKMESKDALATKGSLYVGTGNKTTVTDSSGKTHLIPVTTAIEPTEADNDYVLIRDSTQDTGWRIGRINATGIEKEAIKRYHLEERGEYWVGRLVAQGNNVTGGIIQIYEGASCTQISHRMLEYKHGDILGQFYFPQRTTEEPETFATEESVEKTLDTHLRFWCHHIHMNITHQDSKSTFVIDADFVTQSNAALETFDEVFKLLKQKRAVVMTGTGNLGTGKTFYNAGSSSQQVPNGKAYVVTMGFYDDRVSSDSWCFNASTLLESSGNAYYGLYSLNVKDFDSFIVSDSVSAFASSDLFQIS